MDSIEPTPDYYCVFARWVPGIYTSFEEVQEQINDFHGASWCKFAILDNADKAWVIFFGDGDYDRGLSRINNGLAPEPVTLDHYREKQRLALQALHERFRREDRLTLPHYLHSDDLAPKTPTNAHLLTFSMRKLLSDACDKLDIPQPLYQVVRKTFRDGRTCYRHLASLVPSTYQQPLVESSQIAFDDETSIEDAARMTLRALYASLEVVIIDYNYDIVQTLTDKYANLTDHFRNIWRNGKMNVAHSDDTEKPPEKVFDLDAITNHRMGASGSAIPPESD